jgi:diguanylate cyclase (GGDEF)-like protein/PAS domain S-box-containing protein
VFQEGFHVGLGSENILLAYVFAVVISAGVGVLAWLRRALPGARPFALLALSEAIWTSAYIFQFISADLNSKLLWNSIQLTMVVVTVLCYLRFAQSYLNNAQVNPSWIFRVLTLAGLLLSAWIWTDSVHHLFRFNPHLVKDGAYQTLIFQDGPSFSLFTIFSYGLIAFGTFILAVSFLNSPRVYRLQAGTVLLGMLIPWVTSLLAFFRLIDLPLHDITPLAFAPGNLLIFWALFRFHLFDITPIARDLLVERMHEGVIVLDARKRIVDFNPAAREILALSNADSLGKFIGRELPALHQFVIHLIQSPNARTEFSIDVLGMPTRFELTATPIYNQLGSLSGHLVLMRDITEQRRIQEKLQLLALTDSLTGCLNRRAFFELAATEFERSRRYQRPLSFIILDVDNFKKVNDTYGHLVGDQALEGMAHACQNSLRDADKLGRYGGEEFVVMLPETDTEGARLAAERMRQIIENNIIQCPQGELHISASLGVATFGPGQMQTSLDRLLGQADAALYHAKQAGRNQVCVWQDPSLSFSESLKV